MAKFETRELREVFNILMDHVEKTSVSIDLDCDYYWNIPKEQRYDPYKKPDDLDMGQISDNWNELQKISSGTSEPLSYGLVWLAALLQAVGEELIT